MHKAYRSRFFWGYFLWGLGGQLQLFGTSLSFTELFVFAATPFVISRELIYMRKTGVLPFFWLSVFVAIGCAVSCVANRTAFVFALRGCAVTFLLPCAIVMSHWMLRRHMDGFKWILVGGVISSFLCTFFFQKAIEMQMASQGGMGEATAEAIMSGPIYWIGRLGQLLQLPARGWYLSCPMAYCVGAPLFMAGFSMLTSASGRSAALGALASSVLVIIGGKRRQTMRRIGRYFWLLAGCSVVGVVAVKGLYSYAAVHDWLGERAREKYELQTRGGTSIGKLLLGGRMEAFGGLVACVDKPIIGFGPWPEDRWGYNLQFLIKYGQPEDFERYQRIENRRIAEGRGSKCIMGHSYITEFWLWYGIFGLLLWLYVIYVVIRYLKDDCWAVPQWYMWLAASVPGFLWNVFFSPFSSRVGTMMFVVACLLVRAVRRGKTEMPFSMIREIVEHNA